MTYHDDGTVASITPRDGAPAVVTKRIVHDMDKSYFPVNTIVPSTEIVQDRVTLEQLRGRIDEHKESKDPQPLTLSVREVGDMLSGSGVSAEKVEAFQQECRKQYGEDAELNPKNIIESGKFQITTPEVKITVPPEYSYMVETRIIDGRRFILIPADDGVEVNGIGVNIPGLAKEE